MGLKEKIEADAVNEWIKEAKATAKHLENGSGTVASCPAHADMARGVKLCLRLLLCVLAESASPRRQAAWNGAAAFAAIVIVEILRAIFGGHAGDAELLTATRKAIESIGAGL